MSELSKQQSPLAAVLSKRRDTAVAPEMAGVLVTEQIFKGYLNVRGDPDEDAFAQTVGEALGCELPREPNTISSSFDRDPPLEAGVFVCWTGPDEWLVTTASNMQTELLFRLRKATAELHAAVTDITGGYTTFRLDGLFVRDLLAKGCTLDLHPRCFHPGQCAQTNVGKTGVMLIPMRTDTDDHCFDLIVRRSFADYLFRWIEHSSTEYGLRVSGN